MLANPVAENVAVHTAIAVPNVLGDGVTAENEDVHAAIEVPMNWVIMSWVKIKMIIMIYTQP
jgi:hypothetical protein